MNNFNKLSSVAQAAAQIKTTVTQVPVNEKSVEGAVVAIMTQPTQVNEQVEVLKEGWDDMVKDAKARVSSAPKPSGGSGVKQGTRYGGGKQTSKPEQEETSEEKPKAKKSKFSEMVNLYQEKGLKALSEMSVQEDVEQVDEALKGNQHKIDKNKNNKIDAHDFKLLHKEESEQLDELSKDTLNSYVGAAKQDNKDHADSRRSGDKEEAKWAKDRMVKRSTGIGAAQNRLNKEETEIQVIDADLANGVDTVNIQERSLTASETAKREDIVKGMKKSMAGFKERYGKDAKSVMYATATKQAKKD
jgi:hypothetical protein